MLSQSLLQLKAVILHPAPDRGVIDIETALLQQFLNIAQRQRIAKIPPNRTKVG
jgi:aspartate carbamoyltransferase catalytic subunit